MGDLCLRPTHIGLTPVYEKRFFKLTGTRVHQGCVYSDGFSLFCVNFWVDRRRKYDHITPALYNHHWLPVFYCIYFKILIITFKAIYNMSLSYISNLVSIKSCSVYSLRSNSSLFLDRPKGRTISTLGARSFYVSAPTLWNSLPANIREITSLSIFKTHLFNLAYNE